MSLSALESFPEYFAVVGKMKESYRGYIHSRGEEGQPTLDAAKPFAFPNP